MVDVLSEILSNAVGIAISPLPIIAAIVILFTPAARTNAPAFLVGWAAGITLVGGVFAVVGPLADGDDPGNVAGIVKLVVGALFLFLAWRQWQGRPRDGEEPRAPKLLTSLEGCTPVAALGIGLALSVVNPKNLGLAGAAGATIGAAELGGGDTTLAVLFLVVVGSSTVAIPVIAHLVAADRVAPVLRAAQTWLTANNTTVMMVLFLVLGAKLLGDGLQILV